MEITRGKIAKAQKVVIYGPEGVGKSTLASKFPTPLFIDTEGSTNHMDVPRLPRPSSWSMLQDEIRYVRDTPSICGTLIIDTADWAEQLCVAHVCATKLPPKGKEINGIEDFGYGKGYTYLAEEFGRILNLLEEVIAKGINVVLTAHALMQKVDLPEETGSYDHWGMKLGKKTAPLVKEWADMILFANYKVYVVNVDNQGVQKGKNKAQGGARVMYTEHRPVWDAKNRHGLPEEIPMDYAAITHCIPVAGNPATPQPQQAPTPVAPVVTSEPPKADPPPAPPVIPDGSIPQGLADLMAVNQVTPDEIQTAVALKGYYPKNTPISNYDPQFISGVLIGAWAQVFQMILTNRSNAAPF